MEKTKVCIFDAYGTLFDVNAACRELSIEVGEKWEELATLWRLRQVEYTWLRNSMNEYIDFWEITENALEYAMEVGSLGVSLSTHAKIHLPLIANSAAIADHELLVALRAGRRFCRCGRAIRGAPCSSGGQGSQGARVCQRPAEQGQVLVAAKNACSEPCTLNLGSSLCPSGERSGALLLVGQPKKSLVTLLCTSCRLTSM